LFLGLFAFGLTQLTNITIEQAILSIDPHDWECSDEFEYAQQYPYIRDCPLYLSYRNLNRVLETMEYSLYGSLTGGIQFTNLLKAPFNYSGEIRGEFIRNLVAGILSPSLQLFFIMRYLKKRSFEKAKREYAA
jgi:hypothetical protein